jgi:hypothetical protein
MIPIDSGNLRDCLIACLIVVCCYTPIRLFHYHDQLWPRVKIHQRVNLGEKRVPRHYRACSGRSPLMFRDASDCDGNSVVFSHVKFPPERRP